MQENIAIAIVLFGLFVWSIYLRDDDLVVKSRKLPLEADEKICRARYIIVKSFASMYAGGMIMYLTIYESYDLIVKYRVFFSNTDAVRRMLSLTYPIFIVMGYIFLTFIQNGFRVLFNRRAIPLISGVFLGEILTKWFQKDR